MEKDFIKLFNELSEKLIGEKIEIRLENRFSFHNRHKHITIAPFGEGKEAEALISKWYSKRNIYFSSIMIGFLHELGHYYMDKKHKLSREFYHEQASKIHTLGIVSDIMGISDEKHLDLYYKIEVEKMANDFVFEVSALQKNLIAEYDAEITGTYSW